MTLRIRLHHSRSILPAGKFYSQNCILSTQATAPLSRQSNLGSAKFEGHAPWSSDRCDTLYRMAASTLSTPFRTVVAQSGSCESASLSARVSVGSCTPLEVVIDTKMTVD